MASALRSVLLASFVCGVTVLLAPGCSQQGEGERCDRVKTQNSDCDSGLVCVPARQLVDPSSDRCCAPTAGDDTDPRCRRKTGTTDPGTGEGGSADTGEQPAGGASGESSGGASGAPMTEPDAGGNGGASPEPGSGGQPSAGAPATEAGGAPAAAGAAGAGGA
jgi:hypothetical protein